MGSKKNLLFLLILIFIGVIAKNFSTIREYTSFLQRERQFTSSNLKTKSVQISSSLSLQEKKTVKKSAGSAIKILSRSQDGMIAASTGTVFSHNERYYVVTVAHGIVGECKTTIIWAGGSNLTMCSEIIVIDHEADYSIIEIDKPIGVEPVKLKSSLPRFRNNNATSIQNKVYYTGFPNSVGPLTISGRIVGLLQREYLIIHSYAWSGASGSGVFSSDGTFIGIIKAVDVGQTVHGVDVLEDMVIILMESQINWKLIL